MYNLYQHPNQPKLNSSIDNRNPFKIQQTLDLYNKQRYEQQNLFQSQSCSYEKDLKYNFQREQQNQNMDIELNIQLNSRSNYLKQQYYERYKTIQNTKKAMMQSKEKENNLQLKTEETFQNKEGKLVLQQQQNGSNKAFSRGNLQKQMCQKKLTQFNSSLQNNQNEQYDFQVKETKIIGNFSNQNQYYDKNFHRKAPQGMLLIEQNKNKEVNQEKSKQGKRHQQNNQSVDLKSSSYERRCNTEFGERGLKKVQKNLGEKNIQSYQRDLSNIDNENLNRERIKSSFLKSENQYNLESKVNNFCNDSYVEGFGSQIYRRNNSSDKPIKFVQQIYQKHKRPPVVFKQKRNENNQSVEINKNSFIQKNSNQLIDKLTNSYKQITQIDLIRIPPQKLAFSKKSLDFKIDDCEQSYRSIPASDLSARESKIKAQVQNQIKGNKYALKKQESQPKQNENSQQIKSYDEQTIDNFFSIQFPNQTLSNATNDQNDDSLVLVSKENNQQKIKLMYDHCIQSYQNFENVQNVYNGQVTPIYVKPGSAKLKNSNSRKSSKVRFGQEFKEGRIRSLTEQSESKDEKVSINKILVDSFFGKKIASQEEQIAFNTQDNSVISNQYIHDDILLENSENKNRNGNQYNFLQRNILVKSFNEL